MCNIVYFMNLNTNTTNMVETHTTNKKKTKKNVLQKKHTTPQNNTTTKTIDEKHTELLNEFDKIETETIPQLQDENEKLKEILKSKIHSDNIEKKMEIKDKIKKNKELLKDMKQKKKNYLLENSKYIFNYFEQKKEISGGGGKQNVNILNNFFKIKATTEESSDVTNKKYALSKNIYNNYWKNVNNVITNAQDYVNSTDICTKCEKGELIHQEDEGVLICNNKNCGSFIVHIIDNSKPTNKEPPNEVSYTAYIRLNHFKEILSQFQAKETTQIPDVVIEKIKQRIAKERITNLSIINYEKMREILRKLGYNKYFEHIQYINSILGIKPPIMSEELIETLCVLFIEIQKPWAIYCPSNRTNFFNYTYTLFQLCVLLDQTQYLPYISQLKDRDKQKEQDSIWKNVCAYLDWEFIPSI